MIATFVVLGVVFIAALLVVTALVSWIGIRNQAERPGETEDQMKERNRRSGQFWRGIMWGYFIFCFGSWAYYVLAPRRLGWALPPIWIAFGTWWFYAYAPEGIRGRILALIAGLCARWQTMRQRLNQILDRIYLSSVRRFLAVALPWTVAMVVWLVALARLYQAGLPGPGPMTPAKIALGFFWVIPAITVVYTTYTWVDTRRWTTTMCALCACLGVQWLISGIGDHAYLPRAGMAIAAAIVAGRLTFPFYGPVAR